jgi:hypothetical protein
MYVHMYYTEIEFAQAFYVCTINVMEYNKVNTELQNVGIYK